jgi:hypothetical protein
MVELSASQWFCVATVPLLTFIFIAAAVSTIRTYREWTFDAKALLWCALVNVVWILHELHCFHVLVTLNFALESFMLQYILFNVNRLLSAYNKQQLLLQASCVAGLSVCLVSLVTSFLRESQYQIILIKCVDFVLGV